MNLIDWPLNCMEPGQKYGRLTVLSTHKIKGTYRYFAKCQCDCGSEPIYVRVDALRKPEGRSRKPTRSCGCFHKEQVTTHGAWGHPIFKIWSAMMIRCNDPNNKRYPRYGGRGIAVCDRWHDVKNFIADMSKGYRKGLQIDRINNDKGYSKENCHWVTRTEQARNKSSNVLITFNGETHCLKEWSHLLGITYGTLVERVQVLGWPPEKALTQPVREGNYHWRKT